MTELSVLSVKKRGTKNVDLVNKTESLKTSFRPWKVLEKSLNFVCLKLYEPCWCYRWSCLLLMQFTHKVTCLLWLWKTRLIGDSKLNDSPAGKVILWSYSQCIMQIGSECWCYRWSCLSLMQFTHKVTCLLWLWKTRLIGDSKLNDSPAGKVILWSYSQCIMQIGSECLSD